MSIASTHGVILGETTQYTLCVVFPSGILKGLIVLEGFCWELIKSVQWSIYDSKVGSE
jgi:hypothetical protein